LCEFLGTDAGNSYNQQQQRFRTDESKSKSISVKLKKIIGEANRRTGDEVVSVEDPGEKFRVNPIKTLGL
jgi:hypothetical protein